MKALIDKKMIEQVIAEFEQDNPELSFHEMSSAEFADRMMKKIKITDDAVSPANNSTDWGEPRR